MALLLVRHAHAGSRGAYRGDDRERGLSARGRARAEELVGLLAPFGPRRILSSPFVRCRQTLQPLADSLGLPVEDVDELGEGRGDDAVALLHRLAGQAVALCSHGDVGDVVGAALGARSILDLVPVGRTGPHLEKGDVWVIDTVSGHLAVTRWLRRPPAGAARHERDVAT